MGPRGPYDIDSTVVRLVVAGDSGVGKSLFAKRLVAQLGGRCLRADGTTVGAHIESVVWPASIADRASGGNSRPVVVELVEVGGNRGFPAEARAPLYSGCAGVVMMYDEAKADSRKSLVAWFNEISDAHSGSGLPFPRIIVVGARVGVAQGAGVGYVSGAAVGGSSPAESPAFDDASPRQRQLPAALAPVVKAVDAARECVFGVALVVLSFILLGPGRTMFPWAGVPASRAIEHIEHECAAHSASENQRRAPAAPSHSHGPNQRLTNAFGTPLEDASPSGASPFAVPPSGGPNPFCGHVPGVSLANDRDFAASGEAVFDFVAEVVRCTSPSSSIASTGSGGGWR